MVLWEHGESRLEYFYFSTLSKRHTYTTIRADSVMVGDSTMLEFKEVDLLIQVAYLISLTVD